MLVVILGVLGVIIVGGVVVKIMLVRCGIIKIRR